MTNDDALRHWATAIQKTSSGRPHTLTAAERQALTYYGAASMVQPRIQRKVMTDITPGPPAKIRRTS
jgi:hypothetical protein